MHNSYNLGKKTVIPLVETAPHGVEPQPHRPIADLCSRDGKLCCYGRLEYDFLAFSCAWLPTFLIFFFLIPVCLQYLVRVPSSMQQSPSVTTLTKYVVCEDNNNNNNNNK